MIENSTEIRVRYGETDQMGYVYYGNYALYYEVGRVELMRKVGISYREIEAMGIGLPVVSFEIKYIKPAKYDDLIKVRTLVPKLPDTKIHFDYECYNEKGELLNTGKVILVFINLSTGKPMRCPEEVSHYFNRHL
ncbi:MAG: acyl-CoA thioesterase [Flavobacteriales bacterium]|nr:acyl-CoA thioesterase [Flavobacteriales bacterium]